jgi:murein DD-endopeptidase MepM/ murein hydrolase activator NlpD
MRTLLAALLVTVTICGVDEASAMALPTAFEPPVDAVVSDPYRPPATPYGPGNRGIEYDTTPGQAVSAAGSGTVVFSGWVGGEQYVTVDHGAQLRTTYSWLTSRAVERGDRVRRGARLGLAGDRFHFGARIEGEYVDPSLLFGSVLVRVRLIAFEQVYRSAGSGYAAELGRRVGPVTTRRPPGCIAVSDCIAFR